MNLQLQPLKQSVFVGDKLPVRTKFIFDEDEEIYWSGIRLLTSPPCKKDLQITKQDLFSKGFFEAGEYVREKAITIKNNVVPTIKKRKLHYRLQLLLRKPNPINDDDHLIIQKNEDIEIKPKESSSVKKVNPISFSISGLHVNLKKDVFKPGETIKINYSSEELKEIEIRLLQKANLVCYCEPYGKNCQNIEELPPAIAGDVKTKSNVNEGYLLLKVPEIAEPSHNYLWEPSEKEHWGLKYGDYSEWKLLVIGRRIADSGRTPIQFELPITIMAKPLPEERAEVDLFSSGAAEAPSLFNGVSSKFQKVFKINSTEKLESGSSEFLNYGITIENTSKNDLEGVSVKITGLQEGLFETTPYLNGFQSWKSGTEKTLIYKTKQKIAAIVAIIEDNSQQSIRIQSAI